MNLNIKVSIAEFLGNVGGFWGELTELRTRMNFGRKDLLQSREEQKTTTSEWGQ